MAVSLRKYLLEKIRDLRQQITDSRETTNEALVIARNISDEHFRSLNGEQARIAKIQELYYPRELAERLEKEVHHLQITGAELHGKASQSSFLVAILISGFGLLFTLCALMISLSNFLISLALAIRLFVQ